MRIEGYFIQGVLLGFEWDWDEKWVSLNLFIIKIIFDYSYFGDNGPKYGY